jgi:sugar lactone lactonase YvrE
MSDRPDVEVLARVGGELLEGPSWDAERGRLLFVDIAGGRRHALDWRTGAISTFEVAETTSAWIPRVGGGTVVVGRSGVRLADADGEGPLAVEIESDRPRNRSNDAKCDPAGRLWVGTMVDGRELPEGGLYRVEPTLEVAKVLDPVRMGNGLGWSPDGRWMYFVDTPTRRVDVLAFDVGSGAATSRRPLADLSAVAGIPDGLAMDEDGCLWVAMHDGWAVVRIAPDGRLLLTVEMPVAKPTSCCFVGPALDRLVVTSARSDDGAGGDVFACDVGVHGLPTVPFAG